MLDACQIWTRSLGVSFASDVQIGISSPTFLQPLEVLPVRFWSASSPACLTFCAPGIAVLGRLQLWSGGQARNSDHTKADTAEATSWKSLSSYPSIVAVDLLTACCRRFQSPPSLAGKDDTTAQATRGAEEKGWWSQSYLEEARRWTANSMLIFLLPPWAILHCVDFLATTGARSQETGLQFVPFELLVAFRSSYIGR